MAGGQLPDEGPVRLGSVTLPAGRLVTADYGSGEPVAWATDDPVPETGRVWAALSAASDQTGLVPILLDGLYGDAGRPWDEGEFEDPEDPRQADALDPGALLEDWWNRSNLPDDAGRFPGLAPAEQAPLSPAELQAALDTVLPGLRARKRASAAARIGLVAADRPADVPAAIGWAGCQRERTAVLAITAVLRSWEDRFGAVLVDVGFADLRLLVERPPRSLQAAERIAAEHFAFADECIESYRDIPGIAGRLVKSPVWTFWWD
ncbi:DUF4253 domain-containing protein [Trebonia kvetii]|uniref:DUF4253 domain-containing protein n=1 Tax=Trebonia kvetii TaxID=2480626 RepID=A0A6P2BSM0_9ACTN|nr:DUF4253 domain-containing protein [Trebonia kvetii]TVZ02014.1 DUF4253 domain-containing protein [Trebonia kvetii]